MEGPPRAPTEHQLEATIGRLLQAGVLLAALVVLLGGVLYLLRYGHTAPNYRVFRGEPEHLRSVGGILSNLLALRRRAIIQFGLLLLIITPVARVVFSLVAFARQRDRLYVGVTLLVLAALLYGLFSGRL